MVTSKQRLRVLELDLAERKDEVAPEVAQLKSAESQLEESSARIVHLERLLDDARKEIDENRSGMTVQERESLEKEASQLRELTTQQDDVIAEMEGVMSQMVEAFRESG